MKKIITLLALSFGLVASSFAQPNPELLYYRFDGTGNTVPNMALTPPPGTLTANIMGGLTQGSTGQCGGALIGTGVSSTTDYLNTGYATSLTGTSWTISFWSSNITPSATLFYIFGDGTAGSFRCFTNGVAGATNWILRGTGITDVLLAGGATVAPHLNTFVYDMTLNNIRAYRDGVLINTVNQGAPTIAGAGPFKVMGYNANVGAPLGGRLDEFRMYNRPLNATEVMQLYNRNVTNTISVNFCGTSYTVPSGDETYTTNGTYMDTIPRSYCGDSILTINLTLNTPPTVALGADITQCGGTATLDAGNVGSTYLWSDASTAQTLVVSVTGTYSVVVTAPNGCTGTDVISVTINIPPTVALGPDITQCGGTVTLDAGNPGSAYLWSDASTSQTLVVSATGTYSVLVTDVNGCTGTGTINVTINPAPTVALGPDITQCGGTVTLDAGNVGSAYLWSDASTLQMLTVTATGTYSVLVTAVNGCTATGTINVTINTPPTVALGADITQCGGTATLDAGNVGSTYLWSDASTTQMITVSATGTYSVVVTDINGCTGTGTINVTINTPPTVALGNDTTLCGGPLTLNAGNVGSTYLWSDASTAQMLAATTTGTYSVVVTDINGCTGTDVINVTINSAPTVALGSDTSLCGGTVTLDAGNVGSTYLWSDASTAQTLVVTTTGTYSVVVTGSNGCTGTDVINVTINTLPTVTFTAPTNPCINWPAFALTTGSPSGGTYSGTGVSSGMFNPSVAGVGTFTLTYTFTDVNGCTNFATTTITVNACSGVEEYQNNINQIVFQNPFDNNLTLTFETDFDNNVITIYNSIGDVVMNTAVVSQTTTLNTESLSSGVYFIRVTSPNGVTTYKAVKQ